MKKNERLELIRKIVLENEIETQNELVQLLEAEGLKATQATISRDINAIGIIKVPSDSGKYIYGLSKETARKFMTPLQQACDHILEVSEEIAGLEHMINLSIVPGNSRLLKRLILEEFKDDLFSLISDDDSLLLIAKSVETASFLRENFEQWRKAAR
ncbi:arginine repressor [Streptococcus loxodontisalivarius]|uniref:Arginine repressor n=1 Tax=Streptococcus loxodontisalivarius TaxID=1349415 RepID=A0ABS2PV86_9STRE|nr:ArgR family transcriptional regulator [Streptococcus loxodontisalivarius]MBM7643369.1 transcriptional regulator of arginine metabolism [Streptococcus loxodontisalivarius]